MGSILLGAFSCKLLRQTAAAVLRSRLTMMVVEGEYYNVHTAAAADVIIAAFTLYITLVLRGNTNTRAHVYTHTRVLKAGAAAAT